LAQEKYIRALMDMYVFSDKDFQKQYPKGFQVPQPALRGIGICVVLRDMDPDDVRADKLEASIVSSEILEMKLFGNPFCAFHEILFGAGERIGQPLCVDS